MLLHGDAAATTTQRNPQSLRDPKRGLKGRLDSQQSVQELADTGRYWSASGMGDLTVGLISRELASAGHRRDNRSPVT